MKKTIVTAALLLPAISSAFEVSQFEYDAVQPALDGIIYWSAIFTALLTTVMVFLLAKKMKGGVFNKVLNLIGAGMVLMFLVFLAEEFPQYVPFGSDHIIVNVLFILSFILVALGASKLSDAIAS